MVGIPPGFIYIARQLHRLVRPLALAYTGLSIRTVLFEEPAPHWLRVSAYLFSIPIVAACSVLYTYLRDRREAARRGAALAPRVKSIWPGSLDIILSITQDFRDAHIGSPFDRYCEEYGPVVNVRIMFEDQILTTEPEHIKAVLSTQFNSFEKGLLLPMSTKVPFFIQQSQVRCSGTN
ncbi:hypothetical protein M404DRAFT_545333 [Pisolithus tinctorius Marx 270]|uniref:Cytochrome P450 n=1 Tax=Pisolithus tinctorius Marx 270 TaxID=870435 RepID=A0A0C3J5Z7_PISTI|nr:hypothetical protein M404DRAFT_545333 [Pisolithus tinctorius Marx 270]